MRTGWRCHPPAADEAFAWYALRHSFGIAENPVSRPVLHGVYDLWHRLKIHIRYPHGDRSKPVSYTHLDVYKRQVSVPVVVVTGFEQDKLSDSLYQLRALFFREHIRALMITDYCQGMAMGFEYLPEKDVYKRQ